MLKEIVPGLLSGFTGSYTCERRPLIDLFPLGRSITRINTELFECKEFYGAIITFTWSVFNNATRQGWIVMFVGYFT